MEDKLDITNIEEEIPEVSDLEQLFYEMLRITSANQNNLKDFDSKSEPEQENN